MPKRPKPKVKGATKERTVSVAKQNRIAKQQLQENVNKNTGMKPWQDVKTKRLNDRLDQGRREQWLKRNKDEQPNASNLLTKRGGQIKSKPSYRDPYDAKDSYGGVLPS